MNTLKRQTFTDYNKIFNGFCFVKVPKAVQTPHTTCLSKISLRTRIIFSAIQHDRDKIRYTKALKKKREEEKRIKEMVVKEEIGSPQSIASDTYINTSTPSSSTMVNVVENEPPMAMDPEAQNDVKAIIDDLLRIESKVKSLRNSYRFESQSSATSCMYSRFVYFTHRPFQSSRFLKAFSSVVHILSTRKH